MSHHDAITEAVKAAPPVGALGLTLFGFPLNDLVLIATGIYTVFLIIDKLPAVAARLVSFWRWLKEHT